MNHVLNCRRNWSGQAVFGHAVCRYLLYGLLALLSGGCALLPQPEVVPPDDSVLPDLPAASTTADGYQIVEATLEIHTFRAGWLSGMAHNHVMETDRISGRINIEKSIEASTASLYFRPWDLELDNPASRIAAGAGFESTRTAEDIAATRTRMLGPNGFHANDYPWVVIDVSWQSPEVVKLEIRFRDGVYPVDVPLTWSLEDGLLIASADFELSHRGLGIRPYSAFAGALAVADPIRVQLDLSARLSSSL